jgi:hypothetical protein
MVCQVIWRRFNGLFEDLACMALDGSTTTVGTGDTANDVRFSGCA